jgi:hypothetical protein
VPSNAFAALALAAAATIAQPLKLPKN